MKEQTLSDFLASSFNTVVTIITLVVGPVFVLANILTLWQGVALVLTMVLIMMSSACFRCHKAYKGALDENRKLSQNRDGLIDSKIQIQEDNNRLSSWVERLMDFIILQSVNPAAPIPLIDNVAATRPVSTDEENHEGVDTSGK